MAHFAQLKDGIVVNVIVAEQEVIDGGAFGSGWIQTSYNGNIRGQFAGLGYHYSEEYDKFYAPSPFPSWTLDEKLEWNAPIPKPIDGMHFWDEENQVWNPAPNILP